jgi:hypothetical protein
MRLAWASECRLVSGRDCQEEGGPEEVQDDRLEESRRMLASKVPLVALLVSSRIGTDMPDCK